MVYACMYVCVYIIFMYSHVRSSNLSSPSNCRIYSAPARPPVMAASSFTYYPPGAASGPASAAITNGFVLTSDFTMVRVKTLATTLAGYKVDGLPWENILNNLALTNFSVLPFLRT